MKELFFSGKKRQRLRNFPIYYPARRSPWDRFDVNLKAYSDTFYSNNKRGSSTQPKITRPANRILPVIRFGFTPRRKIANERLLIDCPSPPRDYSSQDFFFFLQGPKTRGQLWLPGGGRNGQLPALCGRLEERVHIARHLQKGNRYGSMALPSVTAASHIHADKRGAAAAGETTAKAPVCYCSPGPRVCSAGSLCSLSPARLVGHCSSQTHTFAPFQTAKF